MIHYPMEKSEFKIFFLKGGWQIIFSLLLLYHYGKQNFLPQKTLSLAFHIKFTKTSIYVNSSSSTCLPTLIILVVIPQY